MVLSFSGAFLAIRVKSKVMHRLLAILLVRFMSCCKVRVDAFKIIMTSRFVDISTNLKSV